jgi:hypothetical protein
LLLIRKRQGLTPPSRRRPTPPAPAELKFWINGKPANGGTVRRTVPAGFTGSETFDVGMDTSSPVADAYFDKAPFAFEGELKNVYFRYLGAEMAKAD